MDEPVKKRLPMRENECSKRYVEGDLKQLPRFVLPILVHCSEEDSAGTSSAVNVYPPLHFLISFPHEQFSESLSRAP